MIRGAPLGVKDTCHHNKTKGDLAKRGKGWHRKERERVASQREEKSGIAKRGKGWHRKDRPLSPSLPTVASPPWVPGENITAARSANHGSCARTVPSPAGIDGI